MGADASTQNPTAAAESESKFEDPFIEASFPPASVPTPAPAPVALKDCHQRALTHARSVASAASQPALTRLLARAKALGLSAGDIYTALGYIQQKAPLLIHIQPRSLTLLASDTHYKNRGEISGFSGRENNESCLYGGHCESVLPFP